MLSLPSIGIHKSVYKLLYNAAPAHVLFLFFSKIFYWKNLRVHFRIKDFSVQQLTASAAFPPNFSIVIPISLHTSVSLATAPSLGMPSLSLLLLSWQDLPGADGGKIWRYGLASEKTLGRLKTNTAIRSSVARADITGLFTLFIGLALEGDEAKVECRGTTSSEIAWMQQEKR